MPTPRTLNIKQNIFMEGKEEKHLQDKILKKINNIYSLDDFKSLNHPPSHGGPNCLMIFMRRFKDKKLKLTKKEWTCLIQNSDLLYTDCSGFDALMSAAIYNSPRQEDLDLTPTQWDYLIKNSDLTKIHRNNNSLMYILQHHQEYKTKINEHTFNYLIDNSNLLQKDKISSLSVLGLIIKNKPDLINKVFTKVISDPEFNINDYKSDLQYKEIRDKMIEIETNITKNNINKSIPNNDNKKSLKI